MRVKQIGTEESKIMKPVISCEQLQNELNFYKSEELLMKLRENNQITIEEFNQISELNRQKFNPLLGPLMCDKP